MGKYLIMLCLATVLVTGCSSNDPQQTVDPVEKKNPFPAIVEPHNGEQAEKVEMLSSSMERCETERSGSLLCKM